MTALEKSVEAQRDLVTQRLASSTWSLRKSPVANGATLLSFALSLSVGINFLAGIKGLSFVGPAFYMALFVLSFFVMARRSRTDAVVTVIAFLYFVTVMLTAAPLEPEPSFVGYGYEVGQIIKFLSWFVVFRAIVQLRKSGEIGSDFVLKILSRLATYTPILYLATFVVGLGVSSYASGAGFKSVFSSLNTINIVMLVLFIFSLYNAFEKGRGRWFAIAGLNGISLVLLGTKSSIIIGFLCALLALFWARRRDSHMLILGGITTLLIATAAVFAGAFASQFESIIARQSFLFANRDFFVFLTSGRTWMLEAAQQQVASSDLGTFIFGHGYYNFLHSLSVKSDYLETSAFRPIEFDWADLFYSYGLVALILVYGFLFAWLLQFLKAPISRSQSPYLLAFGTIIVFGSLGGHVFFEATSSVTLGLVMAGATIADGRKIGQAEKW